ncbi:hypothetical protein HKX48_006213 [Thoreauomyces humboldtii]|nr:hypothetical protein HKX48_006213 [Thoreauomyces humboldtii]
MEARKTHLRQMAGTAVGMLLKPSRGIRDDMLRAGREPKDHRRENRQKLKELQSENRTKQIQRELPQPPPFKLKRFQDVKSRLDTRREPPSPEPVGPQRKTRKGEIPNLLDRKMQWAEEEVERLRMLEESKIPPGMTVVPEEERLATLDALRKKQDELLSVLAHFPVVIETLGQKRRKAAVEAQLKELEDAEDVFSKKRVLVREDREDHRDEGGDGLARKDTVVTPTGVDVWDRARGGRPVGAGAGTGFGDGGSRGGTRRTGMVGGLVR